MKKQTEALKLALEAIPDTIRLMRIYLEEHGNGPYHTEGQLGSLVALRAWTGIEAAIREALAQPEQQFTTTRNAWTGTVTYKCNRCGRDDFRSAHAAKFHECETSSQLEQSDMPDELMETIIENSGGHWVDDEFRIHSTDLTKTLRATYTISSMAQQPEPVIGTKTWFEDGKVVTQHLTAKDIYKEPEQEPVATVIQFDGEKIIDASMEFFDKYPIGTELYTSPPASKPWVGLTDEEIQKIWRNSEHMTVNQVCRAIEAKLREKNA